MSRPAFAPTPAQRQAVLDLKRAHVSDALIAVRIGVSRPTLSRHFRRELERARDALLADLLMSMWRAARKGHATAIKWLARRIDAARKAQGR